MPMCILNRFDLSVSLFLHCKRVTLNYEASYIEREREERPGYCSISVASRLLVVLTFLLIVDLRFMVLLTLLSVASYSIEFRVKIEIVLSILYEIQNSYSSYICKYKC